MRTNGTNSSDAAAAARAAARQAALAQAREAARAAAQARMQAAQQQQAAQARMTSEASSVNGASAQARAGSASGEVALAAPPEAASSDAELLAALGLAPEGLDPQAAAAYMSQLRQQVTGLPPEAVPALSQLLYDPSGFYEQGRAMVGTPYQAQARPDAEAIRAAATGPNLAQQLEANPDLTSYPEATLEQLAAFRQAPSAEVQAALDRAALETLEGDFDPESLNPAMAHIIRTSENPAVRERLAEKLEAWAGERLEASLEGKEREEGVEEGLAAFQEAVVGLAEQTGLGEELQTAAERALQAGEGLIEETAERGRSVWDRVTGAVGGLIEGAFNTIGEGISGALDLIGDTADFALDTFGSAWEGGLDLAAAGFDAVGLEGAADVTRTAGDAVSGVYDWVGDQANNFYDGFGDGIGGTITGIGTTISHPVEAVQGIAHLVTNPSEIVEVGRAIWDEATEHGVAGALGYATAQVLPALISGGSTSGGTILARTGAVLGESRALTALGHVARSSRVGQAATTAARAVGSAASRVAGSAPVRFVRDIPGRLGNTRFVNRLDDFAGGVRTAAGQSERIQAIGARFRAARQAVEGSTPFRAIRSGRESIRNLQDDVLNSYQAGVERLVGRVDDRLVGDISGEIAEGVRSPRLNNAAREAFQARRGSVETPFQRGVDPLDVTGGRESRLSGLDGTNSEAALRGLDRDSFGPVQRSRSEASVLRQRGGGVKPLNHGDVLEGSLRQGGIQPDIIANFDAPEFQSLRQQARAIGRNTDLPLEERIRQLEELTGSAIRRNTDVVPGDPTNWNARFEEVNSRFNPSLTPGASGQIDIAEYLRAGVADCRGFGVIHQMVLQEAGITSGLTYAKTFARTGGGEVAGVSHAFNVYEIGGQQFISDAFNPALSGVSARDAILRGVQDESFVYRFQPSPHSPNFNPTSAPIAPQ